MTSRKYYPALLVGLYSLLGMTIPAAVSQFTMSVSEIASVMQIAEKTVLSAETTRATCLVFSMFLSNIFYQKIGLRKTIGLGVLFQVIPQFFLPAAIKAGSVPLLFLLKGLQGCNAIAFPLYISAILMWVDDAHTGFSTAFFNGSFVAGNGIGGWLAARAIPALGWEPAFYIIGTLCLLCAIPAVLLTAENKTKIKQAAPKTPANKESYWQVAKMLVTWVVILASLSSSWVSQAVAVDLPLYTSYLQYNYAQSGNLMILVSLVTVLASVLAGLTSDKIAAASKNKLRTRCLVLSFGCLLSGAAGLMLPLLASKTFFLYCITVAAMVAGASWASGALWPIMNYVYTKDDVVAGTAFCSSAATVSNPVAPYVTGVIFGAIGLWKIAWWIAAAVSIISFGSCQFLYKRFEKIKAHIK